MATCDVCSKPDSKSRCSSCKIYYYCSSECSKIHWGQGHKQQCKMIVDSQKQMNKKNEETDMLITKLKSIDNDQCCICMDDLSIANAFILPCNHFLCNKCIFELPGKGIYEDDELVCEEPPSCPICRADMPKISDLFQYLYEMAALFLQRAYELPLGSIERLDVCTIAKNQIEKIYSFFREDPSLKSPQLTLYLRILEAKISLYEGNASQGIEMASRLLEEQDLQPQFQVEQLINIGDCYILLEQFEKALNSYCKAMKFCDNSMAKENRTIFHQLTRCFYEIKDYDNALNFGNAAIEMNRHYDGVYKYVALSYKASGNLDKAIETMKQAVLYETPWNQNNIMKVKSFLLELEEEKMNR